MSAEDWRRWNAILEAKFPELRKENAANATTEKPNKEYEADCRRWNAILEAKFPELRETSKPES